MTGSPDAPPPAAGSPWRRALPRLLLALVLLLLAMVPARRLEVTMDLHRLVPAEGAVARAMAAAERFGMADTVLVEVDGRGASQAELLAAVDELGARLEAHEDIAAVRYRVDAADALSVAAVRPWAVELAPTEDLATRLSPPGLDALMTTWLTRLSGPGGSMFRRAFAEDPLDLLGLVTESLRRSERSFRVELVEGRLVDSSGQRGLLVVRPVPPALSMGPDDPFVAAFEAELAATALPARWYGGHRIAAASAAAIHDGVLMAAGVGVLLLAACLLVGFGGLRPLVGLVLPLCLAVAAVLAVAGLRSPVHGATLGFASALLGTAVDYWIHLYVAAAAAGPGATGATGPADRLAGAQAALRRIRPALMLSTASTAGIFLVLATSGSPVVRDLGAMGAAASLGALAGVLLLGPLAFALVGGRLPAGRTGPLRAAPRWLGPALLVLAAVALTLLPAAQLDGDPRGLVLPDDQTQALGEELDRRYGGIGLGGVLLVDGGAGGLDAALDRADRLQQRLAELPGVVVNGPGGLLPGPSLRAERRAALPSPDTLQGRIDAAAQAAGFSPQAFEGAAARLHAAPATPLSPDAWAGTPFAELVDRHITGDEVLLRLGLSDEEAAERVEALVGRVDPDALLLLPSRLSAQGVQQMLAELLRLGGISLLGIGLMLALRFRRARAVVAAALPALMGMVLAAAALVVVGQPWNAVSIAGLVLVLGLGLDHGVFMVELQAEERGPGRAILLSAATTAAGFAPLALTDVPALSGLGLVVLVGVSASALAALVLSRPLVRGQPLLGDGLRRWLRRWGRRLAVALLLLLNLDVLLQQLSWLQPPTPSPQALARTNALSVVETAPGQRSLGPDRLHTSHGIGVLALHGDAWQRGFAQGALTPDHNRRLEAHLRGEFARQVPVAAARALIVRATVLLAPRLDRFFTAEQRLELQAAVAGRQQASGPDTFDRDAPPYTRKVYFHAIHDVGQALVDTPFVAACTGFLAGPPATPDGHWRLARNFDFEGGAIFDQEKLLIVVQPDEGIAYASVGFAGSVGVVTGLNAEGLAVALQAAGSADPPRPGTPMTLIAREILQYASSLDEAEAILAARRGFVSENLLVVDADAGQAAVFEVTPERLARLPLPDDGSLGVANHFRTADLAADPVNQQRLAGITTGARQARMDALLAQHHGQLDDRTAVAILRDRDAVDGSPLPPGHRHAIDAGIASHSVVIDATARSLLVSRAPNTAGGYVGWRLDDLLRGQLEGEIVVEEEGLARTLGIHRGRALLRQAADASPVQAEALALAALDAMPSHPEALAALAHALLDQGRESEAADAVARALAAPPEYAHQQEALSALAARLSGATGASGQGAP